MQPALATPRGKGAVALPHFYVGKRKKEIQELYDKVIWDSLFTCNFSIYKKDTGKL